MPHPAQPPRFLVTAGSTREPIDRVRDWGNIFTGQTGLNVACALASLGPVELLTSNTFHAAAAAGLRHAHPIHAQTYVTHADLLALLQSRAPGVGYAGVFMAAAVSDYTPAGAFGVLSREPGANPGEEVWHVTQAQAGKVKSDHDAIAFLGRRTLKLVDLFRSEWGYKGLLVKFKLEVGLDAPMLIAVGQASRSASGADYLVANELDMVAGKNPGAYLLGDALEEWVPRADLAHRLVRLTADRLGLALPG